MADYTDRYIKDALKMHKGNLLKVRKQIIEWALEDERLMRDLVKPHLNGIIAYNVERVASGRSDKAKELAPLEKLKSKATGKDRFGMEILKAVVDSDAIFGFDDRPASRRKGASQDHVEAIKKLANTRKKSTKKEK